MALIDARDRFDARREAARHQDGRFGEQEHSTPELTLVTDVPPATPTYTQMFDQWRESGADLTEDDAVSILASSEEERAEVRAAWATWQQGQTPTLQQVFSEMNELGELDEEDAQAAAVLAAPTRDTYTGTPEEQANLARTRELNDLLHRAGIAREDLNEKVLAELQDGIHREQDQQQRTAEYQARQALLPDEDDGIRAPRTDAERQIRAGVTAIIEARGYTLAEYSRDGVEYMEKWAAAFIDDDNFPELIAAEVERSREEKAAQDREDRENQDAHLGPLTETVWDDALHEDRLRAQQKVRKYRNTKYVSLKDTNIAIRSELKDSFGKAKFSVVGDSYAGGASTTVRYVDGPPEEAVKEAVSGYAGASFDGMTDLMSYHSVGGFDEDGIPISTHYGANFVFTNREFSDEIKTEAEEFLITAFAAEGKTFDPTERGVPHEIPQAFYARATEENGGQRTGGTGYTFRGGYDHYAGELVTMASTLIANERWAARAK